jgi:hypothetical protein
MCVRTNQGNSIIRSMRLRCSSGLFKTGLIGYAACGGASSRVVEPQCRTRFNHVIRLQPVFLSIEQSNWLGFVDLRALGMGGPSWWLQIDNEWGCASLHFRSRCQRSKMTAGNITGCMLGNLYIYPYLWRLRIQVLQNGETLDTYELLIQQIFEDKRRLRMNTSRANPCTG